MLEFVMNWCGLLRGGGLGGCFGVPVALGILGGGGGLLGFWGLAGGGVWVLLYSGISPLWGCAWALAPAFASGVPLDC